MPGISLVPERQTMKGLIANEALEMEVSETLEIPPMRDNEVLIKVERIGLNPVDTKLYGADFVTPGLIYGFDCAGTVIAIGAEGHRSLKVGDRVCGAASGSKMISRNPTTLKKLN